MIVFFVASTLYFPNNLFSASGKQGVSGEFSIRTGDATRGNAGRVYVHTGNGMHGRGGNIDLFGGDSHSTQYRSGFDGSDINLRAGHSTTKGGNGGSVNIVAGSGRHEDRNDGGDGGAVELHGGHAYGRNKVTDVGGGVVLQGGSSQHAVGGLMNITSGYSASNSSGAVSIVTNKSGKTGVSGEGKNLFAMIDYGNMQSLYLIGIFFTSFHRNRFG